MFHKIASQSGAADGSPNVPLSYQKIELRTYAHSCTAWMKKRTLSTGPPTISGVHNFGCFSKHTNYCIDIEQKPSHDQNSNNDYSD